MEGMEGAIKGAVWVFIIFIFLLKKKHGAIKGVTKTSKTSQPQIY